MKQTLGVFNTDRVNRQGFRFDIAGLASMLNQSWRGSPSFISHDFHRLIGWTNALGLHIQAEEVRLMGRFTFPENQEEHQQMHEQAMLYLQERIGEVKPDLKRQLQDLLGQHLSGEHSFLIRECVSVIDDGIAKRTFPDLFPSDETDKRSLVDVRKLKCIGPGVFEYKGCALFAHRYFRRSLSQLNNLNDVFLAKLLELKDISELEIQIALDPNSVGLPNTYQMPIELQHWWGPRFNDDLTRIPTGVTRHEATERTRDFHGISHMEFWWHQQNDIQTLECEEVRTSRTFGTNFSADYEDDEMYGCRYVHSMVDSKTKLPYHLDGAIREYEETAYIDRLDQDISKSGKTSRYVKLWRVDGPVEINLWKELICHFYRDNELAGEYLGAEKDALAIETMPSQTPAVTANTIFPPRIASEFGVHAMVTYQPLNNYDPEVDCMMIALGAISFAAAQRLVMEYSALDYVKMLRESLEGEVQLSQNIAWICYDDMDINLPLLLLNGRHAVSNTNTALQILWDMCKSFTAQSEHRFITSNISIVASDRLVSISLAAFAKDFVTMLPQGMPKLPEEISDIEEWLTALHATMAKYLKDQVSPCSVEDLMRLNGCFFMSRSFLPESCKVQFNDAGEGTVEFPESETRVVEMISSKQWHLTPARLIYKALCSSCQCEYAACNCKVLITPSSTTVSVEDCELVGFAVTERSANCSAKS
ncbi:hypothetical protein BCF11_3364 [Collimonas sp. PA-H2]|uniref:hypothetical protein n=1 Tax=Collimonas sp. PA-H2 TaxID=1881062 RepID=UPI000BF27A10|nr:hypothetical protein [Collimonas sp. PA-H2]PFH10929.1 hypothetical protein BCF11_3364 [Collimonas sp. PA-H2]